MALRSLGLTSLACLTASTVLVATACDPEKVGETEKITIGGKEFTLKTALDEASRTKGLGGLSELPEYGGMIFVFPDAAIQDFWMKDCVMDIDIAYVDSLGVVTVVYTMTKEKPQGENESAAAYAKRLKRYNSISKVPFAIEVRPGTFAKLGIKRGSKIDFDGKRLKAAAK